MEREGLGYRCLLALGAAGGWTIEVSLGESDVARFAVEIAPSAAVPTLPRGGARG
jgi:hypothetical protein